MQPEIKATDFKGIFKISQDVFKEASLEGYITEYYPDSVVFFLGSYTLEKLQNFPDLVSFQNSKYLDLFEGCFFTYQEKRKRFAGIKQACLAYVYFYYVRDNFQSTVVGKTKNNSELSKNTIQGQIAKNRFNTAVNLNNYQLKDFLEAFKNFSQDITNIVNLDGTNFEIHSAAKYTDVGDKVEIEGQEYEVKTKTVNGFTVENLQDIAATDYTFSPFSDIEFSKKEYAF